MEISTVEYPKKITDKGYIRVFYNGNWIYEHILVVEKFIGRELFEGEVIHHIDSNKQNNNINNLMLFPNQAAHAHFHRQIKQFGVTRPRLREIKERWKNVKER